MGAHHAAKAPAGTRWREGSCDQGDCDQGESDDGGRPAPFALGRVAPSVCRACSNAAASISPRANRARSRAIAASSSGRPTAAPIAQTTSSTIPTTNNTPASVYSQAPK